MANRPLEQGYHSFYPLLIGCLDFLTGWHLAACHRAILADFYDLASRLWLSSYEYFLIFSTGSISLVIAILDLTGLFDWNSWVAQRVSSLTLLAVGFIASYLILERHGKIDVMADNLDKGIDSVLQAIANSATKTIRALDGVEVVSFPSKAAYITYASKRFRKATHHDAEITAGYRSKPRVSRNYIGHYQETPGYL